MDFDTINDRETMDSNAKPLHAGRYRIVKRLGQGGMGSVWLAEDIQLDNRLCAIKTLPSILVSNKRAYKQLKEEALVSMKLTHPNIVTLRAFEENNGNPFLVMDYVDGETLDDYLGDKGTLPEEEVIKLLKPIAEALDYAHKEGVVHRDIKPANVMIRKDGHPYILDFGIAREIQETMTRVTGKLSSGTLLYMSPEQLNGESPKAPQDIYSFGAMVYECLKGEPPFVRGQLEHQILNNEPTPLAENITISKQVQASLAKRATDRPTTCLAVLGADECAAQAEEEAKERAEKAKQEELRKAAIRDAQERARKEAEEAERQRAEEARKQAEIRAQERARHSKNIKTFWVIFLVGLSIFCGIRYYQEKEQARQAAIEQVRREAEDAKRKAEEEARRKAQAEAEAKERAEKARKEAEEAERQRAAEEAKRIAAEEAARKAEEAARAVREAQAAAEAKLRELEAKQAALEEEARRKAQAEAEARRKAQAEAEARRKAQAEAEARRKAQAEAEAKERAEKARKEAEDAKRIAEDKYTEPKTGDLKTITLPGGAKMEMIYVGPGEFIMGSPTTENGRDDDETQHRVRLTKGYWLSKYEVTQAQWESVMGNNPSHFKGYKRPIENVSWNDCQKFIEKVNAENDFTVRLPTEAEWEYACRAGTTTVYSWGNALNGDKANCDGNYPYGTTVKGIYKKATETVGSYKPNAWGFYDMHGNVWEWCQDWYGDYSNQPTTDPKGPASGGYRVMRGGSWNFSARYCRSARRFRLRPVYRVNCGFRLACSAGPRE